MKNRSITIFLLIATVATALSDDKKPSAKQNNRFKIAACSGVNSPTKGEEVIDLDHGEFTYHVRILHSEISDDLHVSTPFFWVRERRWESLIGGFVTLPSIREGLQSHSLKASLFFSEEGLAKNKALSGFLLEDAYDNMDWGSGGILFVFTNNKSTGWRWKYTRLPSKERGKFTIYSTNNQSRLAPEVLLKRLAPVLSYAEKRANRWPGP